MRGGYKITLAFFTVVALVLAAQLGFKLFGGGARPVVEEVPANNCPSSSEIPSLRCEVNAVRKANGLPPLKINLRLRAAAQAHARDMIGRGYFAHNSPDGQTPTARAARAGYVRPNVRAWRIGENIGYGTGSSGTPRAIVQAWMHSPPHRKILLDRGFREGGGGIATSPALPGVPVVSMYVLDVGVRR